MRMRWYYILTLLGSLGMCAVFTAGYAATPGATDEGESDSNLYRAYTSALQVNNAGVAAIPSRFQWSVETSWRGTDAQGKDLPDARVMLRLYDPDQNFTALTAQMDLATAEKLHRELGEVITKKRQDRSYQHRPQLYGSKQIPRGRFKGVDKNGTAIIELEDTTPPSPSRPSPE